MRTFKTLDSFIRFEEFKDVSKRAYLETVFLDEETLSLAIEFYNEYFGYNQNPISRDDVFAYVKLGVRLNADLFKSMLPMDENKLNYFYEITPFYFFHDIVRFMDGFHMEEIREIEDKGKPPFLDYAGGTGGYSIYLAKKGYDVTFLETNKIQLAWVRWIVKRINLNIDIQTDYTKLTKKYSFVIAKDIAEHVLDPGQLHDFLKSLLLEDGHLVMTQAPCCGPDELAPMHFKIDKEGEFIKYNVNENLRCLQRLN